MKKRLIITITDIKGTQSYNFSDAIKKIFKYSILSLGAILLIGIITIITLSTILSNMGSKEDLLNEKLSTLNDKNKNLNDSILKKTDELKSISFKVEDMEKIVGIVPDEYNESEMSSRVDMAKIAYVQKKYMFSVIPSGWPLIDKGTTASYGWRKHPILNKRHFHPGIDLRARMRTNVKTTADGVVKYAGFNNKGYGYMIIVSHNFGFETLYAHLYKLKVRIGDVVYKNDIIGLSGNSGLSSGPHLHYEVRYAQKRLEPAHFMNWSMLHYDKIFTKTRRIKWHSLIRQITKQIRPLKQLSSEMEQPLMAKSKLKQL